MKADGDKIILESRREIDLLQNAIEIAFASKDANANELYLEQWQMKY